MQSELEHEGKEFVAEEGFQPLCTVMLLATETQVCVVGGDNLEVEEGDL